MKSKEITAKQGSKRAIVRKNINKNKNKNLIIMHKSSLNLKKTSMCKKLMNNQKDNMITHKIFNRKASLFKFKITLKQGFIIS